jgi:hypothetical protein
MGRLIRPLFSLFIFFFSSFRLLELIDTTVGLPPRSHGWSDHFSVKALDPFFIIGVAFLPLQNVAYPQAMT